MSYLSKLINPKLRRSIAFGVQTSWKVNKWFTLTTVIIYVIQGLLPLAIAFLAGALIDNILNYLGGELTSATPIIMLLLLLGFAQLFYNLSMQVNSYINQKINFEIIEHIDSLLQKKFTEIDHYHYEDTDFHKHFQKVSFNLYPIAEFFHQLVGVIASFVQIVATGIAIVLLNPIVALVLALGVWPLMKVQMWGASERWRIWEKIDEEHALQWGLHWDILSLTKISEVKIYRIFSYLNDLWKKMFRATEGARLDIEKRMQAKQFKASIFASITQTSVIGWLIYRVLRVPGFTIGSLEAYRRIINDFSNASTRFVSGLQQTTEASMYVSDYLDLIELEPKVKPPKKGHKIPAKKVPRIEFENVSFTYPKGGESVLKKLSFVIEPGEDWAIVGENGAGKSTLIKLLLRFYDPTEGRILVDNKDLKNVDLDSWYRHIGVLFQHFNRYEYFKARRNIEVGDIEKAKNMKEIVKAAKKARAHDFIKKLPKGYDTVLSTRYTDGRELSGGEWQRVALARAFLRNPSVLILDEPTSAIDAKGEYEIFKRVFETQKNKTTLIVSHRFSTVRNANKIIVVENGEIVETGTHKSLIKLKNGKYREMFELQAEGYK